MNNTFEMVAKTMQGLEDILAEELRDLGATNVEPGRRMVSFEGDKEMLYKANLCCRTALRILKPIYKFKASDTDSLYEAVKEFDWGSLLSVDKTFAIDTVAFSDEFTHSQFVTYRVKDAIVDWFRDRYGDNKRPGVRLQEADVLINVHIADDRVTLSLDSSGESLHKRGYRVAQTEAPINEVLAAGIILRSGWRGDSPLVDPMCGSGTFLIEAALIATNTNPGIYRKSFAFQNWADYDPQLFEELYNDDSREREFNYKIYGADISVNAIDIARSNVKSAGMSRYIELQTKPLAQWISAPAEGVMITNPPYGERISADDMDGLYQLIGDKLKNVFKGYHAWIIGYRKEYFDKIHLSPSVKIPLLNGALECELREYEIFEGDYKSYRQSGKKLHRGDEIDETRQRRDSKERKDRRREFKSDRKEGKFDRKDSKFDRKKGDFDRKDAKGDKRGFNSKDDRRDARPDKRDFNNDRRFKKEFDRRSRFDDSDNDFAASSDNPFAVRRNEQALKSITGKQPSLTGANATPIMRSRGWRKADK